MSTALQRFDALRHAIAVCERLEDASDIHAKALALESYARQVKDRELERRVAELRLRAERRAGELMGALRRAPAGDRKSPQSVSNDGTLIEPSEYAAALDRAGITRQTAHRWQQLAKIPENDFEAEMANKTVPSASRLLGQKRAPVPRVLKKKTAASERVRQRLQVAPASLLSASLRQAMRGLQEASDSVLESHADEIQQLADEVSAALERARSLPLKAA